MFFRMDFKSGFWRLLDAPGDGPESKNHVKPLYCRTKSRWSQNPKSRSPGSPWAPFWSTFGGSREVQDRFFRRSRLAEGARGPKKKVKKWSRKKKLEKGELLRVPAAEAGGPGWGGGILRSRLWRDRNEIQYGLHHYNDGPDIYRLPPLPPTSPTLDDSMIRWLDSVIPYWLTGLGRLLSFCWLLSSIHRFIDSSDLAAGLTGWVGLAGCLG